SRSTVPSAKDTLPPFQGFHSKAPEVQRSCLAGSEGDARYLVPWPDQPGNVSAVRIKPYENLARPRRVQRRRDNAPVSPHDIDGQTAASPQSRDTAITPRARERRQKLDGSQLTWLVVPHPRALQQHLRNRRCSAKVAVDLE